MSGIERKIDMSLDDIIKASGPRTGGGSGGGGSERRPQKAADERIPVPRNGIAPKFVGEPSRQAGRTTGRQAQSFRSLGLTARQAPMKKYAQSRAPLHVSIPSTNSTRASGGGRAGGTVTDVRVTIPNNRKVRSLPPPGFAVADDVHAAPPGMPARGRGTAGRGAPTLNERFTLVLSGPTTTAPARRRNPTTVRTGGGRRGGNGAAPMEM